MMDLNEAIHSRRSVRAYKDEPLTRETVDKLIRAAVQAPSASNRQPWAFVVIQGNERLQGLSERAKQHRLTDTQDPPSDSLRARLMDSGYNLFHGAGTLIVICATPVYRYAAEDCSLAAQNLMLTAHALGLGTCAIGLSRSFCNRAEVKAEFNIPAEYTPVFPVVVGHPATVPAPTSRNEPEILAWVEG